MPELRRTVLNLSQISPAKYNPRRIDAASMQGLTKSIDHFGLVQEFVVNEKPDGSFQLISGHQRMKALKQRGEKTVPCFIVSIDDVQERALNVALNSGALSGTDTRRPCSTSVCIVRSGKMLIPDPSTTASLID